MDILRDTHSSISDTAGATIPDGNRKRVFVCRYAVNFIANDSPSYDLLINFDQPVGRPGTITLKAGEVMSDLHIVCDELYAQGVGAAVPFRAVGS